MSFVKYTAPRSGHRRIVFGLPPVYARSVAVNACGKLFRDGQRTPQGGK
jgi:hypothetical protein